MTSQRRTPPSAAPTPVFLYASTPGVWASPGVDWQAGWTCCVWRVPLGGYLGVRRTLHLGRWRAWAGALRRSMFFCVVRGRVCIFSKTCRSLVLRLDRCDNALVTVVVHFSDGAPRFAWRSWACWLASFVSSDLVHHGMSCMSCHVGPRHVIFLACLDTCKQ